MTERDRQPPGEAGELIGDGWRDGSLTWLEAHALRRKQRALADGKLTSSEHRTIREAQNNAARHIHQERHDGQARSWWWRLRP